MRILVLGGYGAMAHVIVRDLIESGAETIVAGRNLKKSEEFVERLKTKKAIPSQIDVTDKDLSQKIKNLEPDVVINSTWYEYNMTVMSACIKARVHYVDLGGLYWKTLEQLKLNKDAMKKDIMCILGVGGTPGITNVMAHHASHGFDKIDKVFITGASVGLEKSEFIIPYSVYTLIDEFTKDAIILENGKIRNIPALSRRYKIEFPKPIGEAVVFTSLHSELATMPKHIDKGVKDMEFSYGYGEDTVNLFKSMDRMGLLDKQPVKFDGENIIPYKFVGEMIRKIPRPKVDPKDFEVLRVDLHGKKDKKKLFVRMDANVNYHKRWGISSGTVDTGIPPSIVAQWIASGVIVKRGVLPPGPVIDDVEGSHRRFFIELNKRDRGIKIYKTTNNKAKKTLF